MKIKFKWWGCILTPENENDEALLKRLYESINEVDTFQPYYEPDDCVNFNNGSLVIHREEGAKGDCDG